MKEPVNILIISILFASFLACRPSGETPATSDSDSVAVETPTVETTPEYKVTLRAFMKHEDIFDDSNDLTKSQFEFNNLGNGLLVEVNVDAKGAESGEIELFVTELYEDHDRQLLKGSRTAKLTEPYTASFEFDTGEEWIGCNDILLAVLINKQEVHRDTLVFDCGE